VQKNFIHDTFTRDWLAGPALAFLRPYIGKLSLGDPYWKLPIHALYLPCSLQGLIQFTFICLLCKVHGTARHCYISYTWMHCSVFVVLILAVLMCLCSKVYVVYKYLSSLVGILQWVNCTASSLAIRQPVLPPLLISCT